MIRARLQIGILVVLTAVATPGCELWPHNLKPHRLWRLNRIPARSSNAYFSVPDDPPAHSPGEEDRQPPRSLADDLAE